LVSDIQVLRVLSNPTLSTTEAFQVAEKLLGLYFIEGSYYYEGFINSKAKQYRHVKQPITLDKLISHIQGEISIGAPSVFGDLSKWVNVDIDENDVDMAIRGRNALIDKGIPVYVSFSGRKGYHLTVFFQGEVPLFTTQALSGRLRGILEGIKYDKISPSPSGNGGDCIKLPLGIHPETLNRCYFLDDDFSPVNDSISFLEELKYYEANNKPSTNLVTGEIKTSLPSGISPRSCINRLWRDGLQDAGTRHSATCVIANSLLRNPQIKDKEQALLEWAYRVYPKSSVNGYVNSDMQEMVSEVKRLLTYYQKYGPFVESCQNEVFKVAMRSACEDEFQCQLQQNKGNINFKLLTRLGVFNAHNAKPRGIGKSAWAIYWAIEDIAADYSSMEWKGMPLFTLSNQQLVSLANCCKTTVIKHKKRLVELGLIVKVPVSELPRQHKINPHWDNFYALPQLDNDLVSNLLRVLRGRV